MADIPGGLLGPPDQREGASTFLSPEPGARRPTTSVMVPCATLTATMQELLQHLSAGEPQDTYLSCSRSLSQ